MLHVVGGKCQRSAQVVLGEVRVRFGTSANERPAPSLRRMCSTVMRVPLMHGLPQIAQNRLAMNAAAQVYIRPLPAPPS
jgi:hypothetical protein